MRYAGHSSIAIAIGTFGLCIAAPAHGQTIGQAIEIRSVGEFESVFERYRYTSKAWHTGVHEVPRLYLAEVPTYWRDTYSKRVPISEKKSLFFRLLAPVSLYVNEHILGDRSRAQTLLASEAAGQILTAEDRAEFRRKRAEARAHGKLPRGHDLVETMSRYSERGHHYVAELKTIMRQNKLDPIDESKLVEMEIVQLVLVN